MLLGFSSKHTQVDIPEILTASFKDSDSPEVRSKKVDEFCIETMRGLLGEYYAERMAEDGNDD